eukprot:2318-Heterococcus_DN1.PRE.1
MQQEICNKRAAACISNSQIVGPLSSNNSDDMNFFDRAHEREMFDALLGQRPASIRVVLGPTNCGKSTLLRNYVLHQQLTSFPVLVANIPWKHWEQSKKSVLYAAALFSVQLPVTDNIHFIAAQAAFHLEQSMRTRQAPSSKLRVLLGAYGSLLQGWEVARKEDTNFNMKWPVLIIDEANKLQQWSHMYERDLNTLLYFLVGQNKQLNWCHLLLVTSEYGILNWLDK